MEFKSVHSMLPFQMKLLLNTGYIHPVNFFSNFNSLYILDSLHTWPILLKTGLKVTEFNDVSPTTYFTFRIFSQEQAFLSPFIPISSI